MLSAYRLEGAGLARLADGAALSDAIWIDLCRPDAAETAATVALGFAIPSLEEMEEIEISNRLYRTDGADYMTVVLPARSGAEAGISGPVTFILAPDRLVTVRHHDPRPFETFPPRADTVSAGCSTPERIFLGLVEEIVARIADLMEAVGRTLDETARTVYGGGAAQRAQQLQTTLETVGREGELLGRLQLSLLTLQRALSHFQQTPRREGAPLPELAAGQLRDMAALSVHAEFLSGRVTLVTDATLGMINLAQNGTVRIVSVVAALFLPPTLIASIYGMNFAAMPELAAPWGYPAALGLMLASAVLTYLYFRWRGWM